MTSFKPTWTDPRNPRGWCVPAKNFLRRVQRLGVATAVASGCMVSSLANAEPDTQACLVFEGVGAGDAEALCDRGCAAACLAIASQATDEQELYTAYQQACAAGSHRACVLTTIRHLAADREALLNKRSAACKEGDAVACGVAAGIASLGQDVAKTQTLAWRGCDLGDSHACFQLSRTLRGQKRETIEERSCTMGWPEACAEVGRRKLELPETWSEGIRLARAACHAGVDGACVSMGRAYEGIAAKPDYARAATLYHGACIRGASEGCLAAARLLDSGRVAGDAEGYRRLALKWARIKCEVHRSATECARAAYLTKGEEADSLRARACSLDKAWCAAE